ncbi:MAG: hypothetical protein FJ291_22065 [Planctomycetes bacterium]|nr:hypothetical protein [Planctomycetota bacterium]
MKKLVVIAGIVCLALPALAADEQAPPPGPGGGIRGRIRERIVERFDKDGDGKLSREELTAALAALRAKLQEVRERRAGRGPRAGLGPRV